MATIVLDPYIGDNVLTARQATDGHRWDEFWDGDAVIMPLPDNEQQEMATRIGIVLILALGGLPSRHKVYMGINVSDRADDWLTNVRCPDLAVYRADTSAINHHTHYQGGPDFLVEVLAAGDIGWCRKKLPFYGAVGTREALYIDRDPWRLELYRLTDGVLALVGTSTVADPTTLASAVVPVTFRLVPGDRPGIELTDTGTGQVWPV